MKNIDRRSFIQFSGATAITAHPSFGLLHRIFNFSGQQRENSVYFDYGYFRSVDLLELMFSFVNLKLQAGKLVIVGQPAAILIELPLMHKLEPSFREGEHDAIANGTNPEKLLNAYLPGPSSLVYAVTRDNIPFDISELLKWKSSTYFTMVGTDKEARFYNKPSTDSPQITDGENPAFRITTFEAPTGFYIAPVKPAKGRLLFLHDNIKSVITGLSASELVLKKVTDDGLAQSRVFKLESSENGSRVLDRDYTKLRQPPAVELWNNDLLGDGGRPPQLRLIDTDPYGVDEKDELVEPDSYDKQLMSNQFRTSQPWARQEVIEVYSDFFKLTGQGLYAKLQYVTADKEALLQKWRQEMVLGRDQFIEIEYLGYFYPFAGRCALVKITERRMDRGDAFLETKLHIKPIDTHIVYRTNQEQGGDARVPVADTALVASPDPLQSSVRSLKRSTPFQQIEVVTTISGPIEDITAHFRQKLSATSLETRITQQAKDFAATILPALQSVLNALLTSLKTERDQLLEQKKLLATSLWSGMPQWIRDLVTQGSFSDGRLQAAANQLNTATLDQVMHFQSYYTEFTGFINNLGTSDWANARTLNVDAVKAVLKQAEGKINQVIQIISSSYEETIDYSVETLKKEFKHFADNITNRLDDDLKAELGPDATAAFQNFDQYCEDIKTKIDADSAHARQLANLACERVMHWYQHFQGTAAYEGIDKTDAVLFEQKVAGYRDACNRAVSVASAALDNPQEAILAFWPTQSQNKKEVFFEFIGTDWDGKKAHFKAPFIFLKHEAVRQTDALIKKANDQLTSQFNLDLAKGEDFLRSKGTEMEGKIAALKAKLDNMSSAAELQALQAQFADVFTYQKVQVLYERINLLDDQVKDHYQRASNTVLRQIDLAGQKVAYYKSKAIAAEDDAKKTAEEKINEAETLYIELTAAGMAQTNLLKRRITVGANIMLDGFNDQFRAGFTALDSASARLAGIKDVAERKVGTLISYCEAYKQAGMELIDGVQKNSDQLLYEVRDRAKSYVGDVRDTIRKQREQLDLSLDQVNDFLTRQHAAFQQAAVQTKADVDKLIADARRTTKVWYDTADHIQNAFKDYSTNEEGALRDMFGNAGKRLTGAINPSTLPTVVATGKNAYSAAKSTVDRYTGEVTNLIQHEKQTVAGVEQDVQKYVATAKNDVRARINGLLGDLKLFGISIGSLIRDNIPLDKLPQTSMETVTENQAIAGQQVAVPVAVKLAYSWHSSEKDDLFDSNAIFKNTGDDKKTKTSIHVDVQMQVPIRPGTKAPSVTHSKITLQNFGLNIPIGSNNLITVYFQEVGFVNTATITNGKLSSTSGTTVKIAGVDFQYFLELIKKLEELLGIKDGFILDISARGILISLGIRLPTISAGPFTITNAAIYVGVRLHFDTKTLPSIRFAFSERLNPFTLAVGIFGGRGFVGLEASSQGMQLFEASLEFGGYLGLSLGVASGQAYLMAGIYFRLQKGRGPYIEAYIVCGGFLNIIGIIQVSVVFYLGMSYQEGSLVGRASVTVSISMFFFSASYTLSMEKRLAGSGSGLADGGGARARGSENLLWAAAGRGPYSGEFQNYDDGAPAYKLINNPGERPVRIDDPVALFSHQITAEDARKYTSYYDF